MIQRRRSPDGTRHDIEHGPGPVGRMTVPGQPRYLGAVSVFHPDAVQPKPLVGLFAGQKKAWRARQKA